MIWHIEGTLAEISPTFAVVDCHGVGYGIAISLQTFEKIKGGKAVKLLTHLHVAEDRHDLYGFAEEQERKLFRLLTSVNGVGNSTAMLVLSALKAADIYQTIVHENISVLKSIKGIGEKTAHRIVLELKDKLMKDGGIGPVGGGSLVLAPQREAAEALLSLGFARAAVDKALARVAADVPQNTSVEELIKLSLKIL